LPRGLLVLLLFLALAEALCYLLLGGDGERIALEIDPFARLDRSARDGGREGEGTIIANAVRTEVERAEGGLEDSIGEGPGEPRGTWVSDAIRGEVEHLQVAEGAGSLRARHQHDDGLISYLVGGEVQLADLRRERQHQRKSRCIAVVPRKLVEGQLAARAKHLEQRLAVQPLDCLSLELPIRVVAIAVLMALIKGQRLAR